MYGTALNDSVNAGFDEEKKMKYHPYFNDL